MQFVKSLSHICIHTHMYVKHELGITSQSYIKTLGRQGNNIFHANRWSQQQLHCQVVEHGHEADSFDRGLV